MSIASLGRKSRSLSVLGEHHRGVAIAALGLISLFAAGCEEETPVGPELPIDGTWEMIGIFSDTVGFARCWLSAHPRRPCKSG